MKKLQIEPTTQPIPTPASKDQNLKNALIEAAASLNPDSKSSLEDHSEIVESVAESSAKVIPQVIHPFSLLTRLPILE